MEILIPNAIALNHGESKTFYFKKKEKELSGFLIRNKEGFSAFLNKCKHWPVELDMGDEDYYYAAIDRIQCKSHGATFLLNSGVCDGGPCEGAFLEKFTTKKHDPDVTVFLPDASEASLKPFPLKKSE